jgi:hypothetical protein
LSPSSQHIFFLSPANWSARSRSFSLGQNECLVPQRGVENERVSQCAGHLGDFVEPNSRTAVNVGHYGIEMPVPNGGVFCESVMYRTSIAGLLRAKSAKINPLAKPR